MEQKVNWQDLYLQLRNDFEEKYVELESHLKAVLIENAALKEENAILRAEVRALKEKLSTNSSNSSKPPSQDPHRAKKKKKKSGRRRGGQPGHAGKSRTPYPTEEVNETIQYTPPHCPHCGKNDLKVFKVVESFQTVEIPKPVPIVTQHERVRCHCQQCGRASNRQFPAGLSKRLLGPRAMALFTILIAKLHSTRCQGSYGRIFRNQVLLRADVEHNKGGGRRLDGRVGSSTRCNPRRPQSSIRMKRAGLRTILSNGCGMHQRRKLRCFKYLRSRSRKSAQEVLGDQAGRLLISDRFSAYTWFAQRQYCWAHLKRDFAKIAERSGHGAIIGRLLTGLTKEVFALWYKHLQGEWELKECRLAMTPLREAM